MKSRLMIYYALAVTLTCLWFFFALSPTAKKRQEVRLQTANMELQIADFNRTMLELQNFLKTSSDLESYKTELSTQLYSKKDILKLFDELYKDASIHHMSITEITPPVEELLALNQSMTKPDEPLFINLTLDLDGNYINFGKFVDRLEQTPYFRGFNLCRISSPREEPTKINLNIGFKALLGNFEEGA
ncbi:MAG: hypothetical protein ACOYVF_03970 [Candidatus Zixiibacteriota bacterium]